MNACSLTPQSMTTSFCCVGCTKKVRTGNTDIHISVTDSPIALSETNTTSPSTATIMEPHPSQLDQPINSDVGEILANAQTLWKASQENNKKELKIREERHSRQLEEQRIQHEKKLEEINNHH